MGKKKAGSLKRKGTRKKKRSALVDTRVVYCGDNLEQLGKLPDRCVDLVYIDPPFNSNRNYEVFWGETREKAQQELAFMDDWYPVQVKQKDKVGRPDIDAFETAMQRAERKKGFFVSFDYTSDAEREIGRFFKQTGNVIVPLTVKEILEEHIARKLA